jgi:hypothetical protein
MHMTCAFLPLAFISIGLPLPVLARVSVCGCVCLRLSGCIYEGLGGGRDVCVRVS